MIVLPNSFERYLASLRIFVSLSVLKHGLNPKHLKMLKKITIAEAFYNKNNTQNVDIYKLCKNLLSAVKSVKPTFSFHISASKTHRINKMLFSIVLIVMAKYSDNCEIKAENDYIIIESNTPLKPLSPLLSALNGYGFFDLKHNRSLFVLSAPKTNKPPIYSESEWEYIFDKFSIVNIFFEKIKFN